MRNYSPSLKKFLQLTNKFTLIPVYKQVAADLDTPVSAFLKMSKNDYAFLLESVEGQEKIARYSFLGSRPSLVIESKADSIRIITQEKRLAYRTQTSVLEELRSLMKDIRSEPVKELPRFYGGLVGYLGYDVVRFFEKLPCKNPDELSAPDAVFMLTDTILIFDHIRHSITIVSNVALPGKGKKISQKRKISLYHQALRKIDALERDLRRSLPAQEAKRSKSCVATKLNSNLTKPQFEDIVKKAKKYIRQGDIIQVVLSQRFSAKVNQSAFDIYRNLRQTNPSPYMYFLQCKDTCLIGSSPEMLVRCEDGIIQTRPIAGTRRRGKNPQEDARLERELLKDEKERAEHLMLVDLGRNDLGRVSKKGTVRVSEFMAVERYSHVMHLVSEVTGILDKRFDIYEVLKACFPAGTVAGSPKIRAMEIIDELENTRRGPYAGCVGYFSFSHNMDTCITIRTILMKGKAAYVQAGAGIVADSVPQREYYESVNKAKALTEAMLK